MFGNSKVFLGPPNKGDRPGLPKMCSSMLASTVGNCHREECCREWCSKGHGEVEADMGGIEDFSVLGKGAQSPGVVRGDPRRWGGPAGLQPLAEPLLLQHITAHYSTPLSKDGPEFSSCPGGVDRE